MIVKCEKQAQTGTSEAHFQLTTGSESKELLEQDSEGNITQDLHVFEQNLKSLKEKHLMIQSEDLKREIVDSCSTEKFPSIWKQRNALGLLR